MKNKKITEREIKWRLFLSVVATILFIIAIFVLAYFFIFVLNFLYSIFLINFPKSPQFVCDEINGSYQELTFTHEKFCYINNTRYPMYEDNGVWKIAN
jgi:hypothetical protein